MRLSGILLAIINWFFVGFNIYAALNLAAKSLAWMNWCAAAICCVCAIYMTITLIRDWDIL